MRQRYWKALGPLYETNTCCFLLVHLGKVRCREDLPRYTTQGHQWHTEQVCPPPPMPFLLSSHDWLHLPHVWVTMPLASFPTGNCPFSSSPSFTMEIRNRKRKHHDDTQLAPGFLDQNQIWCLQIWCQFAGYVTLGNYSSLLSAVFSCVKRKWYSLQDGWQTQVIPSPWPKLLTVILPQVQDLFSPMNRTYSLKRWQVVRIRIYTSGVWGWLQEFGVWTNEDVLSHVGTYFIQNSL